MQTETVMKFDELDEKAKDKARDWWRSCDRDDNFWSEGIIDDAKDLLKLLGFRHPEIAFSGFWSQGDGASFTGNWHAADCKPAALKAEFPKEETLHRIADAFAGMIVRCKLADVEVPQFNVVRNGRSYSHERTVSFDWSHNEIDEDAEEDSFPKDLDTPIEEACRDLMCWIYASLEAEYEYHNADEQVDEALRINEYDFTEDGRPA